MGAIGTRMKDVDGKVLVPGDKVQMAFPRSMADPTPQTGQVVEVEYEPRAVVVSADGTRHVLESAALIRTGSGEKVSIS